MFGSILHHFVQLFKIFSVTIVIFFVAIIAATPFAKMYIKNNPDIMMSKADRINQNTRSTRENLIPEDKITEWYDLSSPDELQQMYEERFGAGAEFESYTHFRSRVVPGQYHGATNDGYRLVKNNGPWPLEPDNYNIFFFGGSTSFGVGPYWATVASYLQEILDKKKVLDKKVYVYNFGRSGYQSTQEMILLNLLISRGHIPDAVIFLDGLNDFCFTDGQPSSWQLLARHFNNSNSLYQKRAAGYGVATDWNSARKFLVSLPAVELVSQVLTHIFESPDPKYLGPRDRVRSESRNREPGPPMDVIHEVISRYLANTRQISAIGDAFGFQTLFVWQPIPTYKYDQNHHLFYPDQIGCHTGSRDGYPVMKQDYKFDQLGPNYIWIADMQEQYEENVYIDAFHYTAPMSRNIAEKITEIAILNNLLEK